MLPKNRTRNISIKSVNVPLEDTAIARTEGGAANDINLNTGKAAYRIEITTAGANNAGTNIVLDLINVNTPSPSISHPGTILIWVPMDAQATKLVPFLSATAAGATVQTWNLHTIIATAGAVIAKYLVYVVESHQ